MTETKAEIRSRLRAIKSARDSGVLTVRHGDTTTMFRSLKEMNQIIADLENQLTPKSRLRYITQTSRGY